MMDLEERLPWNLLKRWYRLARLEWFTVGRHSGEYLVVDMEVGEVERLLGSLHFAPNWEFSYHKRGEDLNLARVSYAGAGPDGVEWWQDHVRGWDLGDGRTALKAHWEPEPTESPRVHARGALQERESGMDALRHVLSQEGVEYEPMPESEVFG